MRSDPRIVRGLGVAIVTLFLAAGAVFAANGITGPTPTSDPSLVTLNTSGTAEPTETPDPPETAEPTEAAEPPETAEPTEAAEPARVAEGDS